MNFTPAPLPINWTAQILLLASYVFCASELLIEDRQINRDMPAKATIRRLRRQIVLGVSRLYIAGEDRIRILGRLFGIGQDQPPALILPLEMMSQTASVDDLGERLFQCRDGVAANVMARAESEIWKSVRAKFPSCIPAPVQSA